MNTAQKQFLKILSSAIYNKEIEFDPKEKIKWKSIIEEARAHNVTGLIYSSISRSEYLNTIDKKSLEQLKKETFLTGVSQIQHINQVSKVLNKLNNEKIPVIVLKGLVIRELYPKPELRTMCDADILVKEEDIEKVKDELNQLGYKIYSSDEKHIVFQHEDHLPIEVHWTLTNRKYYNGRPIFEYHLWEDIMKVKVGDIVACSLSYEDLAVHLCVHLAAHCTSSGFGIRQLCDLVLFVKTKGCFIDWLSFLNKIRICGIEKFTIVIFLICKELFEMQIPFENSILSNRENLYLLIDAIVNAGVHGKRSLSKMYGNQIAYYVHNNDGLSITKRIIAQLFPPINKLPKRFDYAKKYTILTPVAWSHWFLYGIFNKEYDFLNKLKLLSSTLFISRRRNKLLRWLELI